MLLTVCWRAREVLAYASWRRWSGPYCSPCGAVGGVAVLQARAALRDGILSASLAAADMAAAQTASYVADTRGTVMLLADRFDVQRAMERHDDDYLDDVLEQWSARNPHNDGVFLFADDGTLLADGVGKDGGGKTTVTERDWFKAVRITHLVDVRVPISSLILNGSSV